jgi:hypothetical protein
VSQNLISSGWPDTAVGGLLYLLMAQDTFANGESIGKVSRSSAGSLSSGARRRTNLRISMMMNRSWVTSGQKA